MFTFLETLTYVETVHLVAILIIVIATAGGVAWAIFGNGDTDHLYPGGR